MNGKGSKPRPTNAKIYRKNYDSIFMNEPPEYSTNMQFHESKRFEADDQKSSFSRYRRDDLLLPR